MTFLRLASVSGADFESWASVDQDDRLLVASGVLFVAACSLSGSDLVSSTLVSGAIIGGLRPVTRRFTGCVPSQLVAAIAVFWLIFGLLVGSLPSPMDPGAVFRWGSTEGRSLLALFAIAVGASFRSERAVVTMLRSIVFVISLSLVIGFVSHVFHVGPPLYEHRPRKLFHGLTSSHHVPGFLGASVVLIVASLPRQFSLRTRLVAVLVGLVAVGWSASRTSLAALAVALIVLFAHLLSRRRLCLAIAAVVCVSAALVPVVPRFRQTIEIVTRPEFASEVVSSFETGTMRNARRLSDSGVEANILLRFAMWGAEFDDVRRSPLLGLGRFRGDDVETQLFGRDGFVVVALDGERRHSHAQPHNMYLYLLGETGLTGLAVFSTPYVWAVSRSRQRTRRSDVGRAKDDPSPEIVDGPAVSPFGLVHWVAPRTDHGPNRDSWRALARAMLVFGLVAALTSAGLLTTGLGLVVNLAVFGAAGSCERASAGVEVEPGR